MVQWLSHSPCKPGVAGSIPGFSKNLLPVEPSGAPGTTNPQKQPQKTTFYSTGVAQEKNNLEASVVQWLSHSPCKPGVAGSIPGSSKNLLPVEPSGAPGTTNPQKKKQPQKTTFYRTGVAQEKNKESVQSEPKSGRSSLTNEKDHHYFLNRFVCVGEFVDG